jgi:hypothetical protein
MPTIAKPELRTPSVAGAPERALLLACLQRPIASEDVAAAVSSMDESAWPRFVSLAGEQRVRPLVRAALVKHGGSGVPASISQALLDACRRIATVLLSRHGELAGLLRAFAAADIPVIVLKGACLTTLVYRDIGVREMNDLDLLVPQQHLQAAVDVMVGRGYAARREFSVAVDTRVMHHLSTFVKGLVEVEIHWNITLPGRPHTIDPAELWPRAIPLLIGGAPALSLGLDDLLLHLCVHASYQHQFECGLRPSCDIAALIQSFHDRLDWEIVCQRSQQWRCAKGVYVALALAHGLAGAQVPLWVLSRLQGKDGLEAIAAAERLVWTTPGEHAAFTPGVAVFGAHAGWSQRIRDGLARLFLSRSELAFMYSLQPANRWLPLYYNRRMWYLLLRHGPSALRLLARRNPAVLALAERRDFMRHWLLES